MKLHKINNFFFLIRREPYYHKIQYSKTLKFDVSAAVFGVILSAFAGYMGLSTFGSMGADMTDMLTLIWYLLLCYKIYHYFFFLVKTSTWAIMRNSFFLNNIKAVQKKRPKLFDNRVLKQKNFKYMFGFTHSIQSGSCGFLHWKILITFYKFSKKLIFMSRSYSKIWFNLLASTTFSKKPLNVRMGKGKGSYVGIHARVRENVILLCGKRVRYSLWKHIIRFIGRKASFIVLSYYNKCALKFKALSITKILGSNVSSNLRSPLSLANFFLSMSNIRTVKMNNLKISNLITSLTALKKLKILFFFINNFAKFTSIQLFLKPYKNFMWHNTALFFLYKLFSNNYFFFFTRFLLMVQLTDFLWFILIFY